MFKLIFLFFTFLFPVSLLAKVRVESLIRPQAVSPKGRLTLIVEIEYDSEKNIAAPRLPNLEAFHLFGQHQSHQMQITNGTISRKKQYHYLLQPMKEGKFIIGSIDVIVDGKAYKTSPVEVEVSSKIKPRPRSSPSPFGRGMGLGKLFPHSFFNDEEDLHSFSRETIQEKDISLKLETDKSTMYLGEMVLAEWFFYSLGNKVINIQSEIIISPNLDGFWVESVLQFGNTSSVPVQSKEIDGKQYKRKLLSSSALFPVRTGTLSIGEMKIKSHLFGGFSLLIAPKVFLQNSDKKTIKVLPLPKEGKGIFFTEAVGDFNISASINKKIVSVQEPIVYKVRFTGKGHPRLIRMPDLDFGDALEIYDITESQEFSVSNSVKTFEMILIPGSPGEQVIPSFELSTFDPQLGIYKTHILPSFKLKVAGVKVPNSYKDKDKSYFDRDAGIEKSRENKKIDERVEENILHPWTKDEKTEFLIKKRRGFWFVVYGFLFLFFILALKRYFSFGKEKNSLKARLKENLRRVDKAIKSKDWKKSGIELNQIVFLFFSELSGQNKAVKSWDALFQNIHPSIRIKYESETRALVSLLEQLSFASFEEAKGLRNKKSVEKLKKELVTLIEKISAEYSYLGVLLRTDRKRQS